MAATTEIEPAIVESEGEEEIVIIEGDANVTAQNGEEVSPEQKENEGDEKEELVKSVSPDVAGDEEEKEIEITITVNDEGESEQDDPAVLQITQQGEEDDAETKVREHETDPEPEDEKEEKRDGSSKASSVGSETVSFITFHDLAYEVQQRKCFKRLPNKTILDSVCGEMKTGVNAIMGPTGSGKTTLLDLLADRKDKSGKSGKVLINGHKRQSNYKTVVGYVVQDDVVMGTLSVRENLEFSAALRLPSHMTRAQRKERVERVIETLSLYRCADTKVGTEFFRGVSGGERKRTNIGMELIIEPQVLFLDEPTTGLDANTAVSVVSLLKQMSVNEKRLIVLSIHQPRYSIFKLFDSLTLLSHGSVVYHGPSNSALSYFDRLGYSCEEHENPADFFLDTIISSENRLRQRQQETVYFSNALLADGEEGIVQNALRGGTSNSKREEEEEEDKSIQLAERYRESKEYRTLRKRIDPILQDVVEEKKKETVASRVLRKVFASKLYATSFPWQYLIVTMRSVKNLLRSPQLSVFQLVFTSILAIIIGIIYWQLDTLPNGFTDRIGVFFFISTNQSFGSLGAIQLFIQQKALFIHENASGYYRVSTFFLSKITTDLIPLRLIPNAIFAIIVYFSVGFQVDAGRFFTFWLILTLVQICAVSIAFFISAGVRNGEIANLLIVLPFIFSLLFGGLLISLDSLPVWVSWLRHFSFIKYGVESFAINEMNGLVFRGPCEVERVTNSMMEGCNVTSMPVFDTADNCTSECVIDGLAQLGQLGYGNTVSILWWDVFALVVYSSVFLTLAYLVLRLIKKEK